MHAPENRPTALPSAVRASLPGKRAPTRRRLQRQPDGEARTVFRFAAHIHVAAKQIAHKIEDDRQPSPDPPCRAWS